jgi:hypothetical protein
MKGGGNTTTYSDVKQTTTDLPEYAEPYVKDLMQRAGFESAQEYAGYTGPRIADFSPMEQEAMARYGELGMSGTPEEMKAAGQMAYNAGQAYDHGIGPMRDFQEYVPGELGDAGQFDPQSRESGYAADSYTPGYRAGRRRTGYTAGDRTSEYGAGQHTMGFEAGEMAGDALDKYQDKYMQDVVDIEKREAARQADMRHAATGLDAAGMGSLGGYREAIMRAEAERNLGQNMSDIQTKGSQQAFLNAQQAFEADRQARAMQEKFGQSAFGMNEQARQAQEPFEQSQFGMSEQARQSQEQFGQSQFGMNESARQAQEQFGQSAFGMNEQARQQQEAMEQGQFGLNAMQQQFGAQLGLDAYNARENAMQQATSLGLSAAEVQQQGEIAAANAMNQQRMTSLNAAGMLGDFAGQRQQMEMERLGAMQDAGERQRGLSQAGMDMGYQDFLNQRDWGKQQLAFYNDMIRGNQLLPNQTTSTMGNEPSWGQQMMGAGIGGLGLYNAMSGNGYSGG